VSDSVRFANWSGQYGCEPRRLHRPRHADEVATIVREAARRGARLRAVGAALSPSDIAMSDEEVVVLDGLDRVLAVDVDASLVTVQAGASLAAIDDELGRHGLGLPNFGSIASQTVAGAVATATHGTGLRFGALSTLVEAMTLVAGRGERMRISAREHADCLAGVRCHLGALGIVTDITLRACPRFDLEVKERPASLDVLLDQLPERVAADHYRFWYLPHAETAWEWSATRVPPGEAAPPPGRVESARRWWRERLVGRHAFELLLYLATFCDGLVPPVNRWYARSRFSAPRHGHGPSRSLFTFDCLFRQHVDEWAIPVSETARALRRLRELIRTRRFRVHLPIEVRFVRADDVWLSPSYGRDSCYVGVIAYMPYGRSADHRAYFDAYEALMLDLGGRPHWAKRFGPDAAQLSRLYPCWEMFQTLRDRLDPEDCFGNAFTDRVLGARREVRERAHG
jgi:L-gulonolactone oxidase